MPFIPHTEQDVKEMLSTLQLSSLDALFSEIPADLQVSGIEGIRNGLSEQQVAAEIKAAAKQDSDVLNFIGAGAYEHYIPAAVWDIASRGEWMTAYTPYQAEASQGTLQLLYEFQTMMARLMEMDVS